MGEVASLWATIGWKDGEYERGLSKCEKQWDGFEKKIQQTNGPIGSIASQLGFIATPAGAAAAGIAAVGAAMVGATSASIGWQSTMADVQKTAGASTDISQLSDSLLEMSTVPGMPVKEDLAEIAEMAGSLGVDGTQNVETFTEAIAHATTAFGGISAGDTATSLAKLGNVFDIDVSQTENLASAIDWVGNNLAATEAQTITATGKMAGMGSQFGMTSTEAIGLSGSLIALQMDADSAGTLTSSLISKITAPDAWEKAGELVGMTADEFGRLATTDVDEALLEIAEALEEIEDPVEFRKALDGLNVGLEAEKPLMKMVGHTEEIRENMAGAAEAFEDGTGAATTFAAKAGTSAASISSIVAQVGVIAVKFGDTINYSETFQGVLGDISGGLGAIIDNMDTITGFASHLGEDLKSGLSWLYEASPIDDVFDAAGAADEKWNIGDRIWGAIEEYAGTAGEDAGEEFADAVNDEVSDAAPEIGEDLAEEMDGESVGEKVGKDVIKGLIDSGVSEELAGFVAAGFSDVAALTAYNAQNTTKFSRTGEFSLDSLGTGAVTKVNSGDLNWKLSVNGHIIDSYSSSSALIEDLIKDRPALNALIDPRELQAAIEEAKGNHAEALKIRAEIIADIEFQAMMDQLSEDAKAAEEAFQEMMDGLSESYHAAFDDAMDEGAIIDWMTAWESAGDMAADAFSDNLITGIEARDIAGALQDLEALDPQTFEDLGGEAALKWWQGLSDLLERRADMIAVDINADTSEIDNEISDAVKAGEPYLATIKASVETVIPPDLSEFSRALWWEDYGGSEAQKSLGEYADDLEDLAGAVTTATENQELLAEAFDIVTDQAGHEAATIDLATEALKQYTDIEDKAIDKIRDVYAETEKATEAMKDYGVAVDSAIKAISAFGNWQEDPGNELFQPSLITSSKNYWEEILANPENYRLGQVEYAAELFVKFKADNDAKQQLIADVGFGGEGADITVSVDANIEEAKTDIEGLKTEAQSLVEKPVDADISQALSANRDLEAALSAPVTKTVYVREVASGSSGQRASSSSWLSLASGGIATYPVAAVVGDAPSPEVIAPLDDLRDILDPMIRSAASGGGGSPQPVHIGPIEINVYETGDAEVTARAVMKELETRISQSYEGDGFNG